MGTNIVKDVLTGNFAGRVKHVRNAAGLTQPALARILGLSVSYLSLLESGERTNPTIETVDIICTFFGITRGWLLDGSEPMFAIEDQDQARERFFALIREKVGTDDERALREQKLMAEISVRLAQATVGSPIVWDQCRQEIISAIDAYADYCRTHAPEIRQAGLKIARAAVPKK